MSYEEENCEDESTDDTTRSCPECAEPLTEKTGKYGPFVTCECGFKASLDENGKIKPKNQAHGECPKCGKVTFLKSGKYGQYVACEGYAPGNKGDCSYTAQIGEDGKIQPKKLTGVVEGIKCPKCFKPIVRREGQFGEFFSCSGYPDCKTIVDKNGDLKVKSDKGKGKGKK